MEKKVTEKQLLDAIEKYQGELADNDKVSETKFKHMQAALYGCKMIVRHLFGSKQVQENAMVKSTNP